MAAFMRSYNAALLRRPLLTQCLTSFTLFSAGDVICQQVIEKKGKDHDFLRTARLGFYGGALFGPILSKWLNVLNTRVNFSSYRRTVLARVFADQYIFTPGVLLFFFSSMTFLEGKGPTEAVARIQEAYQPTLLRNWLVFIPAQLVNFAFVPPHLRFPFVGVISLFWNTYLSAVNAKESAIDHEHEHEDEKVEASK